MLLFYLITLSRASEKITRVKGIEPLLTILEIVALTVILHSFHVHFSIFLREKDKETIKSENVMSSFN